MQQKPNTRQFWDQAAIDNLSQSGPTVIAQLGQSLDGQIATVTGQSKYINGPCGLTHLHRLRAWADVLVVGVGTVVADDPMLNVRLVQGNDPHRVVLDPRGRIPVNARMLTAGEVRKVIVTGTPCTPAGLPAGVDVVNLGEPDGSLDPARVLQWLVEQGWRRILIEGGATTITHFLRAGCLDYLHLIVSPLLIGDGTPGLRVNPVAQLSQVRRFKTQVYDLEDDRLVVCAFDHS
jgi:diaminohydroxyphosphoribosylaminopyrimidine deaminase/5-amino-6-(5-phosphoribosylamino)uracil reductase